MKRVAKTWRQKYIRKNLAKKVNNRFIFQYLSVPYFDIFAQLRDAFK